MKEDGEEHKLTTYNTSQRLKSKNDRSVVTQTVSNEKKNVIHFPWKAHVCRIFRFKFHLLPQRTHDISLQHVKIKK